MTIEDDMEEMLLRAEYQNILAAHDKPLPPPFEQWKSQRILTNPATHKAIGKEI